MTMTEQMEFDFTAPQIVMGNDTARTGRNMPPQSHAAGDRSQHNLQALQERVLILVRENPKIIGSELNALYQDTFARRGWKKAAYDSPRKRAEALLHDGYLLELPVRDGGRQYLISELGLKVLA